MRQKGFTPIIVLLVVVLLGALGYLAYTKGYLNQFIGNNITQKTITPAPYPINTKPPNTPDPTANWKTYTSQKYKYEFKYPPESKLSDHSDQYVAVSYMGEKQKASGRTQTELFDGYAFNITDVTGEGYKDLDDFYNAKIDSLKDVCTSVGEPVETTIDEIKAITHKLSCLGDYDAYYIQKGSIFFEIGLLHTGDAEDLPNYTKTVNQIFSTFKFTD